MAPHRWPRRVLAWYEKHGRALPWRRTRDPYAIVVSEMMLQQTQVDRVLPKYEAWLRAFPDWQALAAASARDVLRVWSGLGYNKRALRLQRLAQRVVTLGGLPRTEAGLRELPGIGPYTARAVLAFAFNESVPVIDTNIRRVLLHECKLPETTSPAELERVALSVIPQGRSRDWHNALMDYGALVVTARKTGIKPLSRQSRFHGSHRWWRGRILAALNERARHVDALRRDLEEQHGIADAKLFARAIETLRRDGLITGRRRLSLPA